jgi:D-alanyl-D-alanine carboxypeptidase (penicillin-binding protein 5/6)
VVPLDWNVPPTGELTIFARGAISMDALSGAVLYEKDADSPQYPASTTKVMTALLIIEEGDLDKEVVITAETQKVGESSLYLKEGETYTRRTLLYGALLKSANDACHALAVDNAGSVAAFAEKMTRRAGELGATRTRFRNPHGLHDPQHVTTARDLATIARAAMRQPLFRQIVATRTYPWSNQIIPNLTNHNRLLPRFPGCTGVKTGYTYPAQQCLVSAAQWGTREVIAVVLHTDKPGIWDDSMWLLCRGFARLSAEDGANPPPTPER